MCHSNRKVFYEKNLFAIGACNKAVDLMNQVNNQGFTCICDGRLSTTVYINIVKNSIYENKNFLENVEKVVKKLREVIKNGDKVEIKKCIGENGKLLENLDKNIYSKKLKELASATQDLDICAKSSGAGGGDCGIAFSFDEKDTKIVVEKWRKLGIELLYSEKL